MALAAAKTTNYEENTKFSLKKKNSKFAYASGQKINSKVDQHRQSVAAVD